MTPRSEADQHDSRERSTVRSGTRKIPSLFVLTTLLALTAATGGCTTPLERFEYSEAHMGTQVRLILYGPDRAVADRAAEAAFARVAELDGVFSDYRIDSEVSLLCRVTPSIGAVEVSHDLWNVLDRSRELHRRTGGVFDVTIGPFVRLWRRSERMLALPAPRRLAIAREGVGLSKVTFDQGRRAVSLNAPFMRLDFGGIAKGYAAQEAIDLLREHGVASALVDAGGDVVVGDAPPGSEGWLIGLAPNADTGEPTGAVVLANAAVATSGDAFRFVEIRGRRYSHIIDPRTGLGMTTPMTVTVIAGDGALADGLASALSVLGPKDGFALIESYDGASASVLHEADGTVIRESTPRFPEILAPEDARHRR